MFTSNQAQASFLQPQSSATVPEFDIPLPSAKSLRAIAFSAKLVVADCIGIAAALAAHMLVFERAAPASTKLLLMLGWTYMLVAVYGRTYAPAIAQDVTTSVRRSTLAFLVALASVIFGAVFLDHVSAVWLRPAVSITVSAILTVGAARAALAFLLSARRWRTRLPGSHTVVLVDGDADHPPFAAGDVVVNVAAHGLRADVNDPAALAQLGRLVGDADRVVVSCAPERRAAWSAALGGANAPVELVVEEIGGLVPLGASNFAGRPTLQVAAESLSFEQRLLKRLFDVALASIALVLLLPFFAIVAIAIKIDSPGPVFFRQPRVGRSNRPFRMHKFRSMRVEMQDVNGNRLTTGRDDDRVTRVGRFIRATSIDELPQVIDVLRGKMSIVGPRPHALGAKAGGKLYWEVDRDYWRRHAMKPGITGLAQVRGFRGTTFEEADLRNRLAADLEYVQNWSFVGDVLIVFRTFRALTGQQAF